MMLSHRMAMMLACIAFAMPALAQSWPDLTVWQDGRSRRESSNALVPDRLSWRNNIDCIMDVSPEATAVLADLQGPGVITHIWITFFQMEGHPWAPNGTASPQDMLLRIYYDGRERPDVEAPVGDFFANGFGRQMAVDSLPVVVEDGDAYNCYWRMPFKKSCRVEIVNQNPDKTIHLLYYNVDWIEKKSLPRKTLYFCARYRQEYPLEHGKNYLVLDTSGPGYYVGTVLSVRTRSPQWFGEGDELITIDGEDYPSIRGTGTEDYFLSAWGLKENSTPYFGVPYLNTPQRIIGQRTTSYRWHLLDPIVFRKSIRVEFEHFGWMTRDENPDYEATNWNEREDDYATVAFWYEMGPGKDFAPHTTAAERRLPSLDRVTVWGRDLLGDAHHGAGEAGLQRGNDYIESGGQLFFSPASATDAWIEAEFDIARKEPLRLVLILTQSYDYGIWQPYLNGIKLGKPLDLYAEKPAPREFHIMDFWPDPGHYTLRLERVGRNRDAVGGTLGLDSIRLYERRPRVAEYAHERERDWRESPVLNR